MIQSENPDITIVDRLQIAARVARGVALLDQAQPRWMDLIDLELLELSGCYECVLGQVFGSYLDGRAALWPEDPPHPSTTSSTNALARWSAEHGFFSLEILDRQELVYEEYDLLAAEWKRVIAARRKVRSDS